jgi:hypothetical protein
MAGLFLDLIGYRADFGLIYGTIPIAVHLLERIAHLAPHGGHRRESGETAHAIYHIFTSFQLELNYS